jgi:predicted TIM-barrel fold metal-dependent hydrolase
MNDWIDAHVHVWTDDRASYPHAAGARDYPPPHFTPEEFLAHARPSGVSRAVLVQMSFYRRDHSYLLVAMAAHPGVFAGVGIVDASAPDPAADMRTLAARGLRGFRIAPGSAPRTWLDGAGMAAMWRCAGERRLALCALIDADALPALAAMCARYPDTPVVVDHLARIGVGGVVRDADVRALCALAAHPNVAVKVSAFYALGAGAAPHLDLGPLIRRVYDAFGPRRLMWGSDCPFQVEDGHTYQASVDLIAERLDFLSAEDRAWMLRGAAESIFFR